MSTNNYNEQNNNNYNGQNNMENNEQYYFNNVKEFYTYLDSIPHQFLKEVAHEPEESRNIMAFCLNFLVGVHKARYLEINQATAEDLEYKLRSLGCITRDEAPLDIRSQKQFLSIKEAAEQKDPETQGKFDLPLLIMNDWLSKDHLTIQLSQMRNDEAIVEWGQRNEQLFTQGFIQYPDGEDMIQ